MVSHYHGQTLNLSELGRSFGVSDHTIRRYLEILSGTFMIRLLPPWHANVGKRLVKAPKLYIRDSGLFHALHTIATPVELESHPKLGASWEGFAMEQALCLMDVVHPYFWRTHTGAELDLVWQTHGALWGMEFKYQDAPRMTRSIRAVLRDLPLKHLWIVYPGPDRYRARRGGQRAAGDRTPRDRYGLGRLNGRAFKRSGPGHPGPGARRTPVRGGRGGGRRRRGWWSR